MAQKSVKMWVSPEFKNFIKVKAAENEKSIIDYTEELCKGPKIGKKINNLFERLI